MTSYDIDFIAFNFAFQLHWLTSLMHELPQLCGHRLCGVLVQSQFLSNLHVRQVQSHEVETQHPDLERLMMSFKYRSRQIIKAFLTAMTLIPLSSPLLRMVPSLFVPVKVAMGTTDTLQPSQLSYHRRALAIIYHLLYCYQGFVSPFFRFFLPLAYARNLFLSNSLLFSILGIHIEPKQFVETNFT